MRYFSCRLMEEYSIIVWRTDENRKKQYCVSDMGEDRRRGIKMEGREFR